MDDIIAKLSNLSELIPWSDEYTKELNYCIESLKSIPKIENKCIAEIKISDEDMTNFMKRLESFETVLNLFKWHLKNDDGLLLGWHSNIACWFMDKCNFNHEVSNDLTNIFINNFFDIVYVWEKLVYPSGKISEECYKNFGDDLEGCSTQQSEGCQRCKLYLGNKDSHVDVLKNDDKLPYEFKKE